MKTIIDLLEDVDISWSLYQEDIPYTGSGGNWINHENRANNYVRKHNPLMSYDSVTSNEDCLEKSKNFTMFYSNLKVGTLPQWIFITPNMTNDRHDTSVTIAGAWAKSFLEPLLSNPTFMQNTLIILTFDETKCYLCRNRVFSVLLGDAVSSSLKGTTNDTAFNHYSIISTVDNNWNLGNLGLKDATAPVMIK